MGSKNKTYVGMGGWDLEPFNGSFYPLKPKRGFRKLDFYSRFFDFVELNATFYKTTFTEQQARRWLKDVEGNKDFVFTVKLYRGFTHTFNADRKDIDATRRVLDTLQHGRRLEGVVIQFPYSFRQNDKACIYLSQLAYVFQSYRLFLDVRHKSWNTLSVREFFRETGLYPINIDLPPIKEHMPLLNQVRGGLAYYRLMGRNSTTWDIPLKKDLKTKGLVSDRYLYDYSAQELDQLKQKIELVSPKAEKTFVVFHNDPQAHSLKNGFQLRHFLEKRKPIIPENLVRTFPELHSIEAPESSDLSLFSS